MSGRLGVEPAGIWLPECAYRPGIERYLEELGLRYFFVDAHAITGASPIDGSSSNMIFGLAMSARPIAAAMANPKLVNFAAGLVDSHTLPVEMCGEITRTPPGPVANRLPSVSIFRSTGMRNVSRSCEILPITRKPFWVRNTVYSSLNSGAPPGNLRSA